MVNVTFLISEVWSTSVWSVWSCIAVSQSLDELADVKVSTLHTVKCVHMMRLKMDISVNYMKHVMSLLDI